MTAQIDNYFKKPFGQRCQEQSMVLVDKGHWFYGRAVGMAKPLPLIADVAIHLIFGVGHILGSVLVNPGYRLACLVRKTDYKNICSFSTGTRLVDVTLRLASDIPYSFFSNLRDPKTNNKNPLIQPAATRPEKGLDRPSNLPVPAHIPEPAQPQIQVQLPSPQPSEPEQPQLPEQPPTPSPKVELTRAPSLPFLEQINSAPKLNRVDLTAVTPKLFVYLKHHTTGFDRYELHRWLDQELN